MGLEAITMNKKRWSERLSNFVEGRGFYIILLLCLAVIGLSIYYLIHTFSTLSYDSSDPVAVVGEAEIPAVSSAEVLSPETAAPAAVIPSPQATPVPETTAPEETEAPSSEPAMAEITTWPLQGTVVAAFSPDTLVMDPTMGDWRTHNGIDLAAAVGSNVQAVGDGIVTEIRSDYLLGTVLTIDHGGSLTSSYANLAEETLVSVGDHVSAGCVIGQVGETAAGELDQEAHLHFAMSYGGELADPREYLP